MNDIVMPSLPRHSGRALTGHPTAIDEQANAGSEGRAVAGEVDNRFGDLFSGTHTPHRLHLGKCCLHVVATLRCRLVDHGGVYEPRADGIHPNAEGTRIMTENIYTELKPLLEKGRFAE